MFIQNLLRNIIFFNNVHILTLCDFGDPYIFSQVQLIHRVLKNIENTYVLKWLYTVHNEFSTNQAYMESYIPLETEAKFFLANLYLPLLILASGSLQLWDFHVFFWCAFDT